MNNPTIIAWLLDAGTMLALALFAATAAYGILLLAFPHAALAASAKLDRSYSSRKALRSLEIPHATEPFFYRHHRVVGTLLAAGVAAFFLLYAFGYPRDTVLAALAQEFGKVFAGAVIDAFEWFLLGANLLIGLFAVVMIARPSLLKPLERRANRWISTRQALRGAETTHEPVDAFFSRHPRLAGMLVLLGTGYIGFSLLFALG